MKIQPSAQELINCCSMGTWQWVEWYNFRLKELNKPNGYNKVKEGLNKLKEFRP